MAGNEAFYKAAVLSIVASTISVILLIGITPLLYYRTQNAKLETAMRMGRFREKTNVLWSEIMQMQHGSGIRTERRSGIPNTQFVRSGGFFGPSQNLDPGKCNGCATLHCPPGLSGPRGPPGEDGRPGPPGNTGKPGIDGKDVVMDPIPDLPCVICPGGPPGPRGLQGERGRPGPKGSPGSVGRHGRGGPNGPPGDQGSPGLPGPKGFPGLRGEYGDNAIGGVGIKGAKGPPGPRGPKGPPGVPGKRSNKNGPPGAPGGAGPQGPPGKEGLRGPPGEWGPPGDPGFPATYCPSDCGVREIVAPSLFESDSYNYGQRPQQRYRGGY